MAAPSASPAERSFDARVRADVDRAIREHCVRTELARYGYRERDAIPAAVRDRVRAAADAAARRVATEWSARLGAAERRARAEAAVGEFSDDDDDGGVTGAAAAGDAADATQPAARVRAVTDDTGTRSGARGVAVWRTHARAQC